jgi:hypothetical protein
MLTVHRLAVTLSVLSFMAACGGESASSTPTEPESPDVKKPVVRGVVVDSHGNPIAGVQVFADNTIFYNANAIGVTDAQGRYEIDVSEPIGTWHMSAQLKREYRGRTMTFDLHPDNDAPFPGVHGAVRNFEWKLTGLTPQGFHYGAHVYLYADLTRDLDARYVELIFTPDGPLVDGSAGQAITKRADDGLNINDLPLGQYRIAARYVREGEAPRPLTIRVRNVGDYATSVVAIWPTDSNGRVRTLEIEVSES